MLRSQIRVGGSEVVYNALPFGDRQRDLLRGIAKKYSAFVCRHRKTRYFVRGSLLSGSKGVDRKTQTL